jgi:hypothetical protein
MLLLAVELLLVCKGGEHTYDLLIVSMSMSMSMSMSI